MPGNAPPLTDERELLIAYLQQQRDGVRNAAYGLTDDQARLAPTVSSLTVGGLLKHVTSMERTWAGMVVRRPPEGGEAAYSDSFAFAPDETLAGVLADYEAAGAATDAVVRAHELTDPVPVPQGVPWFPQDVEAWTVRWVVLHLIEETARHAGHADIVRESVDGATMYPLMAGVEGWPATEWLTPWRPPD